MIVENKSRNKGILSLDIEINSKWTSVGKWYFKSGITTIIPISDCIGFPLISCTHHKTRLTVDIPITLRLLYCQLTRDKMEAIRNDISFNFTGPQGDKFKYNDTEFHQYPSGEIKRIN